MNQLKTSIKKHVLNETDMLIRIRKETLQRERTIKMNKKVWISGAVAAAMLIAVVSIWANMIPAAPINSEATSTAAQVASSSTAIQKVAYAMVSVDINPSLEFFTNKDGLVIEIKAKNADAKTLETNDLIGLPVDEAVIKLIERATAAGFIKDGDTTDDYVVVSTVILDEKDVDANKNQDSLGYSIQQAVAAADLGTTTKVAVIKATLREKFAAEGKDIPLGLYIINGMIERDGQMISVSEFAKDKHNVDKLAKRAEIIAAKEARKDAQESRQESR
jgi:hypothetical protein